MAKKNISSQQTITTIIIDEDARGSENNESSKLNSALREISKLDGVVGYIFKDSVSAIIDLKEPQKTVECALFASQTFDAALKFQELFNLEGPVNTILDCENLKMLCIFIGGNTVSVFMERHVEPDKIFTLLPQ